MTGDDSGYRRDADRRVRWMQGSDYRAQSIRRHPLTCSPEIAQESGGCSSVTGSCSRTEKRQVPGILQLCTGAQECDPDTHSESVAVLSALGLEPIARDRRANKPESYAPTHPTSPGRRAC